MVLSNKSIKLNVSRSKFWRAKKKTLLTSQLNQILWQNKKTNSNLKEYQSLCQATAKKFDNPEKEILTWGLGIAGEAGDVASCIKKTFAHNNDQKAGIRENIGDALWYAAMICNFFGWDMQEVLNENIEKLKKRFPNGFTIQDAKRNGTMIDWNKK